MKKKEEEILELDLDFRFKGLGGELSLALNLLAMEEICYMFKVFSVT